MPFDSQNWHEAGTSDLLAILENAYKLFLRLRSSISRHPEIQDVHYVEDYGFDELTLFAINGIE
jgi:hypothetical protein